MVRDKFREVEHIHRISRHSKLHRRDISTSLLSDTAGITAGVFYNGIHKNTIYLKCAVSDSGKMDNLEMYRCSFPSPI